MKRLLFILWILCISSLSFADRVCIEKATGKLIEYQSGNAPLGILTQNAINGGYKVKDIEEKYVSDSEWQQIKKQWIDDPAKVIGDKKNSDKNAAILKLKGLGLTDDEVNAITQ